MSNWKSRAIEISPSKEAGPAWRQRALPVNDTQADTSNAAGLLKEATVGALKTAGGYLQKGLSTVDSYTGAPVRAGIGSLQEGNGFLEGYQNQFGEDPNKAPTGAAIAAKAGISNEPFSDGTKNFVSGLIQHNPIASAVKSALPDSVKERMANVSPADLAGVGIDVAADPSSLLPLVGPVKRYSQEARILKPLLEGLEAGKQKTLGLVGSGAATLGKSLTGTPKPAIKAYALRRPEIMAELEKAGGVPGLMADNIINEQVQATHDAKQALNKQIQVGLQKAPSDRFIAIQPILEDLEKSKTKLNPNYPQDRASMNEIQEIIDAVNADNPGGRASLSSLHQAKEKIRDYAKGGYQANGQIFARSDATQSAAKSASSKAREIFNSHSDAIPEAAQVKKANDELSVLHEVEDKVSRPLLGGNGNPQTALISLANEKAKGLRELKELERITGYPLSRKAEDFYAAQVFHNPDAVSGFQTGRSAIPIAVGSAIGGPVGFGVGTAVGSPLALKAGIYAGRGILAGADKAAGLLNDIEPLGLLGGAKSVNSKYGLLNDTGYQPGRLNYAR